jgi:predicted nuclease with RNAse H fold
MPVRRADAGEVRTVITVGIDLAAEPTNTAIAVLEWRSSSCVLTDLVCPADDNAIVDAAKRAHKVGIDSPLGWPEPFIEFLTQHRAGTVEPPPLGAEKAWRNQLANRLTDQVVHQEFGTIPMSVAADRIARPAMRAAALLSMLSPDGHALDRSGSGLVVEAYPAGSLKRWGLEHRGYKGKDGTTRRRELLANLRRAVPWLDLGDTDARCADSDHCLDAVVAGLTARAASLGLIRQPTPTEQRRAGVEGWIAIPTGDSLGRLLG